MGKYDFRPARVRQATSRLLGTPRLEHRPPWFDVVGNNPPSQILVRTQPIQHPKHTGRRDPRRASKQFRPLPIAYEEDSLRQTFFRDHPWELARPRVMLENDGRGYQNTERVSLAAPGRAVNGERVVQRQLYLMMGENAMSRGAAYDQAREEFYQCRLDEEIESRVAKEEAASTGAYFGKSMVQVSTELEDRAYDTWRVWADQEFTALEQRKLGGLVGSEGAAVEGESETPTSELGESEIATLSTAISLS